MPENNNSNQDTSAVNDNTPPQPPVEGPLRVESPASIIEPAQVIVPNNNPEPNNIVSFSVQPPVLNETVTQPAFPAPVSSPNASKKKLFVPIIAIAAVALLGGSLFAFKQYTSSPSYVWNQGFSNTAKGYEQIVSQAKAVSTKDVQSLNTTGKLSFETETIKVTGSLESNFGEKNGEATFDFKVNSALDGNELTLSAGIDAKLVDGDLYFQARDLDKIGKFLEQMGASPTEIAEVITPYNNQWYVITANELKEITNERVAESEQAIVEDINDKESVAKLTNFLQSLGDTTKKYALTADDKLAIIEQKEFVGKETKNNQTLYHYKAVVNKGNAKKFVKELQELAVKNELLQTADKATSEQISEAIDSISSSYVFDVWVNGDTKLISSMQFPIPKVKGTYIELGLPDSGGDDLQFYVGLHVDASDTNARVTASLNMKTRRIGLEFKFDTAPPVALKGSLSFSATPSTKEPRVTKPSSVKTYDELKRTIEQTEIYINNSSTLSSGSSSEQSLMYPTGEYNEDDEVNYQTNQSGLNLFTQ